MPTDLQFFPAGDRAVLVQLGNAIDEAVNDRVRALYRAVLTAADPAIIEAVPAYTTVLVHYRPEVRSFAEMKTFLTDLASKSAAGGNAESGRRILVVPVCYGLHFGPDLWEMEEKLGLHDGISSRLCLSRRHGQPYCLSAAQKAQASHRCRGCRHCGRSDGHLSVGLARRLAHHRQYADPTVRSR